MRIMTVLQTKEIDLSLFNFFSELKDPRSNQGKRHLFFDLIALTICAVLAGADSWVAIEQFGIAQEDWLRTFLTLPNGIPSHDALGDLFNKLDPIQFEQKFIEWARSLAELLPEDCVAIDGKTLRRSVDKEKGIKALHCVSAFSTKNKLVLGQVKTAEKSNEIIAIPELLKVLKLKGCIITIDAMGCQTNIAQAILDAEADYILQVKKNQPSTLNEIENCFNQALEIKFENVDHRTDQTLEKGHGRIEKRTIHTLEASHCPELVKKWPGLRSIIRLVREREINGQKSIEISYYISSLSYANSKLLSAIRGHWGIENVFHWVLDIAYREDECRIREGDGAENFSILRRLTLNLLRQDESTKVGVATRRHMLGWNHKYREKVLKMA